MHLEWYEFYMTLNEDKMKLFTTLLFSIISFNISSASWSKLNAEDSIYNELAKSHELKLSFLKKKKSSEYFINSLKQLTYRSFWNDKIQQGSVDIAETTFEDLEFILDREFENISSEDIKKIKNFDQLNFYLGEHETKEFSCLDIIFFDQSSKEAAIYYECY